MGWATKLSKACRGALLLLALPLGVSGEEDATAVDRVAGQEVEVLSTRVVDFGDRKMTIRRIEAPELVEQSAALAPSDPNPGQFEALPEYQTLVRQQGKTYFAPFIDARGVIDTGISELRWRDEQGEYVVWTTLNAAHLTALRWVETEHSYFTFFGSVTMETLADIERWNGDVKAHDGPEDALKSIPSLGPVGRDRSYYRFVESPAGMTSQSEASRFMEDLHGYYDANLTEIVDRYQQQEADRLAREEYLRQHPPQPKDTVINWFPIRGGRQ